MYPSVSRQKPAAMTYKITPQHFGFTTSLRLLLVVGSLTCFALAILIPSLISASLPWSWRDFTSSLITWLLLAFWWGYQYHYSLEINDNSARVGGRVVRKGHVRYLREMDCLFGGARLVLSEHGAAWVHLFGGAIVIPKRLPEYEQIKAKVSTWIVNPAPDLK
jgi:hypothetical protein